MFGTVMDFLKNLFASHSGDIVNIVEKGVADGETMFHDIAHGEGGIEKLTKVANDLATLAGHAASVLASLRPAAE